MLDGTGDVTRPIRLSALVPSGFRLLSGDDKTALAYIVAGGDGCISTIANVTPDLCKAIFSSLRQGRLSSFKTWLGLAVARARLLALVTARRRTTTA